MTDTTTNSHVVPNIVLEPEPWQRDKLETRFHMALQAYNRVRDEWLKRRRKYFQSDAYREAGTRDEHVDAMRGVGFEWPGSNDQISAADKNDLFGSPTSRTDWCSDIAHHIPSEPLRRIGGMAAEAVMNFHTREGWGEPSPKKEPPPLIACGPTVELMPGDASVKISGPRGGADTLHIDVNERYLRHRKIQRSLADRSKYAKTMICRNPSTGAPLYKAKATCNGTAPLSPSTELRKGTVGVDVGPSMIAAVSEHGAILTPILDRSFFDEHERALKLIQDKADRQRRANNPDKFGDDGQYVGGGSEWRVSDRLRKSYKRQSEAYRIMCEERRRQHYELAKKLLSLGNKFIVEDNSYSGWQSGLFGAQMGRFAPSKFIDRLEEKSVAAGGGLARVSTWDTKLSSRCHCGREKSKDLSERWHDCECGVSAQRDLYSAFLARHIDVSEGELDADQARESWSKLEPALRSASSESQVANPDLEKVG